MNDHELRERLRRLDPAVVMPVESSRSLAAADRLEQIMTTEDHSTGSDQHVASPMRRPWWIATAAAAAILVVVGAFAVLGGDGVDPGSDPVAGDQTPDSPDSTGDRDAGGGSPETDGPVRELTTADGGTTLASCIRPDATIISQVPLAFRGTVTAVEPAPPDASSDLPLSDEARLVTLTVDEWYVGGEEPTVEVTAPLGLAALLGEIEFTVGEPYLITAVDGVVNLCGLSGPATPELQALFDAAFPA